MRLIDADALKEVTKGLFCPDGFKLELIRAIDNAPTVEERPQGEWVKTALYGQSCYECDNCHLHFDITTNFCPNCGADMRG